MQKPHVPPSRAVRALDRMFALLPEMAEVFLQGVSRVHRRYIGQGEVLQLREVSESCPLRKTKRKTTTVSCGGADQDGG